MTTRRVLLGATAAGLSLGGPARPRAQGAGFPAPPAGRPRDITLLVGAAAGSTTDLWVRGFAPFLERHLRQVQVTVANRTAEGGLAALRDLAASPADGSVLAYAATPQHLARAVERGATALLDRLLFLGAVTEEPVVLVAPPGTELEAFRDGVGTRPLGLPPPVSASAVAALELVQTLPMEQIHFPSAAAARQAAMAGNVAAALVTVAEAMPAVREGRLALLAVAAPARHPQFPEVPTFREAGFPVEGALRRGLAAPAGLPPGVAAALTRALRAAAEDPEFLAQSEARGVLPQFRERSAWEPLIASDLLELRNRWDVSPWPVGGG